jgi:tetratricopeptide (TPR) repeat protein
VSVFGAADVSRGVPAIWGNVPQRNKNFTGRALLLEDLRQRMTGDITAVLPHALQGLGGVGKTQLAIEYAYRHSADYDLVWWISADQPVLVRSTLAALAPRIGITGIAPERVEDAVRAVLDSLRRGDPYERWLLVFDNADQPETIRDLIPNGPGHVIVTSRNHRWQSIVEAIEVDVFTREESLQFLHRRVPGSIDHDYDKLAEELGDLPLALEQAGALQAETGMSVPEYLELLDKEARKLLAENPPSDYQLPVAAAWSLSVARVRDQMPFALELLRRCAFFGPEPIPRDLLQRGKFVLNSPLREALGDPIIVSRGMRELGRYSLAKIDNNRRTLQIHRLIQKLLRDELTEEEAAGIRHEVHLLLAAADPGQPEDLHTWPKYQELLAHVGPSAVSECSNVDVRRLVANVADYLFKIGDFHNCLSMIDLALRNWHAESNEDDRNVMVMLGQKARVLWTLGRYTQAGEIRRANLERVRLVLGEDDEYTLYATNGYGADLRARGDFTAALELDEELLERHRRVFGADHPNTFMVANNLALDYCLNGNYPRARELDEQSYRDRIDFFRRDDHPSVLYSLGALGRDLRLAGEYAAAVDTAKQAREKFKTVTEGQRFPGFTDKHSWVLEQLRDYSVALRKVGQIDEALELATSVYDDYQEVFGSDHADTLGAAINLGNAQRLGGDFTHAAEGFEFAVRRYGEVWGSDHPFTHGCAINLAMVHRLTGRVDLAHDMLEEALAGLRRTIGPHHHYTLTCMTNLATTVAELGDAEGARELGEQALREFKKILGDDHPHTLLCSANLALDRRAVGIRDGAIELEKDTLERYLRTLGEKHPDTIDAIRGVRLTFDFEPPLV